MLRKFRLNKYPALNPVDGNMFGRLNYHTKFKKNEMMEIEIEISPTIRIDGGILRYAV